MRRNAWFNIHVLGAEVHEYLVDFYGPIDDAINAGDESDRLLVAWAVRRWARTDGRRAASGRGRRADAGRHRRAAAHRSRGRPTAGGRGCAPSSAARSPTAGASHDVTEGGDYLVVRGRRCDVTARVCELREIRLPLVTPFRTSFGVQTSRRILLVRAEVELDGTVTEGWGECVAGDEPTYSSEYVDGAALVIREVLAPRLAAVDDLDAASVAGVLEPGPRPPDGQGGAGDGRARRRAARRRALVRRPPRRRRATRIPSGVSVGIHATIDELLAAVAGYVDDGYVRIKLKIEPGCDLEPVAAVRRLIGPDTPLQVDANAAYTRDDIDHLARLDEFDLLLIEQPLPEDDLLGHAELAEAIATPVCLDESITSPTVAADAIELGAAEIVNIKPGRVGGYLDGAAHPRPVPRARHPGVVRRDAGDGHRPGRQRRPRRARRVHAARRRVGVTAVLGPRHRHRADRRRRRPRRRARRDPASASSSTGSGSTRSRPARCSSRAP